MFVMYIILGILYESYIHPLTVLSTLPPAIVGGLGTLWLFGANLSLYSIIGLFLLMGIVKKNGIMIVDFALQRLDEGLDRRAAIHEASVERFRPIMMTTLAALMGAVPLALGYGADGSSRRRWAGDRGRTGGFAAHHAVRHAGDLPVAGMVAGKRARPRAVPAQRPHAPRGRGGRPWPTHRRRLHRRRALSCLEGVRSFACSVRVMRSAAVPNGPSGGTACQLGTGAPKRGWRGRPPYN